MTDRVLSALKDLEVQGEPLTTLEREGAFFALLEGTLVYQDDGGTRRVTLRDLTRIHSDQAGLLRVETPAGTALTASLLGFDPAGVQAFFARVRDATARAKNLPAAPLPTPGGPKTFGAAAKSGPPPSPAPSGEATRDAGSRPPPEDRPAGQGQGSALPPAPALQPVPGKREAPREVRVVTSPPPPVTVSPAPPADPPGKAAAPGKGAAPESASKPAAPVKPAAPGPGPAPVPTGVLTALGERASAVGGLVSRLQLLAAVLGLAAVGLAVFQFLGGNGLSGLWTLIAGGVGCIALLAFADVTRLLVTLARAVAEGRGGDGRGP